MGKRKCEAVASLSSQMKCYFYELLSLSIMHIQRHNACLSQDQQEFPKIVIMLTFQRDFPRIFENSGGNCGEFIEY